MRWRFNRQKKISVYIILVELVLALIIVVINMPFLWMITTSVKVKTEIHQYPPQLIPTRLDLKGYEYIWTLVPFARYLYNSFVVALTIAVAKILLASLAASYSFLWPLIVTNKDRMLVVQIGLKAFQDSRMIEWNALTAASTLATVPIIILFFFVQKLFFEGIAITGLKA